MILNGSPEEIIPCTHYDESGFSRKCLETLVLLVLEESIGGAGQFQGEWDALIIISGEDCKKILLEYQEEQNFPS